MAACQTFLAAKHALIFSHHPLDCINARIMRALKFLVPDITPLKALLLRPTNSLRSAGNNALIRVILSTILIQVFSCHAQP